MAVVVQDSLTGQLGQFDVLLVEKPFTDQALLRTVEAALTR